MDGIISQRKHFSCGENKYFSILLYLGKFSSVEFTVPRQYISIFCNSKFYLLSIKISALKPKDFNSIGLYFRQQSGISNGIGVCIRLLNTSHELVGFIYSWCVTEWSVLNLVGDKKSRESPWVPVGPRESPWVSRNNI